MTLYLALCFFVALSPGAAFAQPTSDRLRLLEERMERFEQAREKENTRMKEQIFHLESENKVWKETAESLKTELQKQKIELQNQKTELQNQKTEIEEQKTKMQEQKTEMQEQKIEIQEQKTEIEEQKIEIQEQKSKLVEQNKRISQLEHDLQFGKKDRGQTLSAQATTAQNRLSPENNIEVEVKRSDDLGALTPVIAQMTQKLDEVTADIQAMKNEDEILKSALQSQDQARGTTYVRWGQAACPNSSETVYSGSVGGSWYADYGAAVNYLCLPSNPTFDQQLKAITEVKAGVWGAEYEMNPAPEHDMTPVCSVCRTPRSAVVMVPATNVCHSGWTLEYSGYLMANYPGHHAASDYICVDKVLGYIPGTKADNDGKLLYYTTARCGSLSCPPYAEGKFIRCAVCSK